MTDKIPGRTVAEVFARFENELTRQTSIRRKLFHGRKLSAEAMTNALVLHFLGLPEHERDSIIDRQVPIYEAMTEDGDGRADLPEFARVETEFPKGEPSRAKTPKKRSG